MKWQLSTILIQLLARGSNSFVPPTKPSRFVHQVAMTTDDTKTPSTFREAEIQGLQYMQDRDYESALKLFQTGLKLPGSRTDVVRNKSLSGPSPVGGSMGGFNSQQTQTLDEFELQAAHYNMACAYAQLGKPQDSIQALETAFQAGFDNFVTVRDDPDLDPIKREKEFEQLMQKYESKKGFNPFGFLGKS